jgi:hypothetical protein
MMVREFKSRIGTGCVEVDVDFISEIRTDRRRKPLPWFTLANLHSTLVSDLVAQRWTHEEDMACISKPSLDDTLADTCSL